MFFPNIQVVGLASKFQERLYSHGIQQAVSRTLANRKHTTELSAVVHKNTKYCKGLVVAVAAGESGIVFGKIALILLDQNRIHLIVEKHQSVLLVDIGVHYLILQGDYICVDIDSLVDYYPLPVYDLCVLFQWLPFITLSVFNFAGVDA